MQCTLQALKLSQESFSKLVEEGYGPKTTENGINYLIKDENKKTEIG